MSDVAKRNEPLGLQHIQARNSSSSLPSPYPQLSRRSSHASSHRAKQEKRRSPDGKIILDPQPDESPNDPLNWPAFRRDLALLSLGLYCMVGGGMTPILAAGFGNVASTFHISTARVSLSTGLYMMGMGIGSVVASPTAILFGKRPVYLVASILFIVTSVWCALSQSFTSLIFGRIFQGIAVSPVECLPSATVAEIFFLHERAYRLGIYTLLLLGGKNLVPLVSAAVINSLGWRWVFYIVAIVVAFCGTLLFFFVPETFWDRTPRPRRFLRHHGHGSGSHHSLNRIFSSKTGREKKRQGDSVAPEDEKTPAAEHGHPTRHVGFADGSADEADRWARRETFPLPAHDGTASHLTTPSLMRHDESWKVLPAGEGPPTPMLHNLNSPFYAVKAQEEQQDYFSLNKPPEEHPVPTDEIAKKAESERKANKRMGVENAPSAANQPKPMKLAIPKSALVKDPQAADVPEHEDLIPTPIIPSPSFEPLTEKETNTSEPRSGYYSPAPNPIPPSPMDYTTYHRSAPPKTWVQTLKPWSGRLSKDNWFKVALRPFILFAYPSILWSTMVYSLSVGWLIVLSESIAVIYRTRDTYNFTALQAGLVYISPFIGGVLGTAVAGKVSDIIVRAMARRNEGIYEPEFRLIMAIPVAVTTVIGLMGFGWSAQEHDAWIVPTIFFGIISFGCSLGSTTAITFAVDSYRGYAGEALVTLNFSKSELPPHGSYFEHKNNSSDTRLMIVQTYSTA